MALRKLSPGGYEYLTGSVACADRELELGESLADYYLANGYPPGEWFGEGARSLGLAGPASQAQMTALFGEGRHPDADAIEPRMIADGATAKQANTATKLGHRFPRYGGWNDMRSALTDAYQAHNRERGKSISAPIDESTRRQIRQRTQRREFVRAHGRPPSDSNELTSWLSNQNRELKAPVAGYEMVFAPPKSVSVTWALADEPNRGLIANLHRQAVRDALAYFESNAAFTRAGRAGEAQVDVQGITAVQFEHWDSRTGDPHLHTHVPISTKVQRATDGKWTALDGRTVYAATVTVSEFYNSRLRDLFREHGASWTEKPADGTDTKRPVWELDGVPQALLRGFSQRTRQVEADRAQRIVQFRRDRDREPSPKELLELSRQAQYASRASKQTPKTLEQHVHQWREQAQQLVSVAVINSLGVRVFGTRPEPAERPNIEVLAKATLAAVEEHHAHFNAWNIHAEAHRQTAHLPLRPAQRDLLVSEISASVMTADGTISLHSASTAAEPAVLRRRDGQSVFVAHNSTRYTTVSLLKAESDVVDFARRSGGHVVPESVVHRASYGHRLNHGQRELVRQFATSGRRVELALAPAGSGKTTAMRVLADAWRASGGRVYAFAPSARAAQELAESVGTAPHTLHQLTAAPARFRFGRGDVVIIDEAAMAGTQTLRTVAQHVLSQGADLRLVGDDHQLGAVEAGGVVGLIAHDVGAVRLDEVVRFNDSAQAAASLQLRSGDHGGLSYYFDRQWVTGGSAESMRDAAHRSWTADLDAGRHTVLVVPTNSDVAALNHEARLQRITTGQVSVENPVALHDGSTASVGDWVVTRHNSRQLALAGRRDFVKNGDTWTVTRTSPDGSLDVVSRTHGDSVRLPANYVRDHVELAYAATVHRVQGMTTDTAHTVVPDSMTREQLYTASTRGREANNMYVVTHEHVADLHHETPPSRSTRDVLTGVLDRVGTPTSATALLREQQRDDNSLATLVRHYNHAARLGDVDLYRDQIRRRASHALDRPAEAALIETLRNAHDLGRNTGQLLSDPNVVGDIADAHDPAAVLAWRIQHDLADGAPRADRGSRTLPWQARPHDHLVGEHNGLATYLTQLNDKITHRVADLHRQATRRPPRWTYRLGPRPVGPGAAQWNRLVALTAAYRETHGVDSSDPNHPVGQRPRGDGPQARAWDSIAAEWTRYKPSLERLFRHDESSRSARHTREDLVRHDAHGEYESASELGTRHGLGY